MNKPSGDDWYNIHPGAMDWRGSKLTGASWQVLKQIDPHPPLGEVVYHPTRSDGMSANKFKVLDMCIKIINTELPRRLKRIMVLRYSRQHSQKLLGHSELAKLLRVSPARIQQLESQALTTIKRKCKIITSEKKVVTGLYGIKYDAGRLVEFLLNRYGPSLIKLRRKYSG